MKGPINFLPSFGVNQDVMGLIENVVILQVIIWVEHIKLRYFV